MSFCAPIDLVLHLVLRLPQRSECVWVHLVGLVLDLQACYELQPKFVLHNGLIYVFQSVHMVICVIDNLIRSYQLALKVGVLFFPHQLFCTKSPASSRGGFSAFSCFTFSSAAVTAEGVVHGSKYLPDILEITQICQKLQLILISQVRVCICSGSIKWLLI